MRQETELAAGMQRQYQLRLLLVQPLFAFLLVVKRFILGLTTRVTERNLWFSQAPVPWFILRAFPLWSAMAVQTPIIDYRTSVERYFLNGMACRRD